VSRVFDLALAGIAGRRRELPAASCGICAGCGVAIAETRGSCGVRGVGGEERDGRREARVPRRLLISLRAGVLQVAAALVFSQRAGDAVARDPQQALRIEDVADVPLTTSLQGGDQVFAQ
jgi:hypothetical protein